MLLSTLIKVKFVCLEFRIGMWKNEILKIIERKLLVPEVINSVDLSTTNVYRTIHS